MPHSSQHNILDHWNALAGQYDQAKARNAAYYRSLQSAIAGAMPEATREHVLEVGCATGQILASLQPRRGIGVDLSEPMIARAREQYGDREEIEFRVMDAADVASLGSFTAVVSADLLEHVPDWPEAVKAIVHAAAPGGRIVIATPNPLWAPVLWALEKVRLKMPEGPHRFVGASAIRAALEHEGCEVLRVETHAMIPARLFGLGPRMSSMATRIPLLNRLGVIQLLVARAPAS